MLSKHPLELPQGRKLSREEIADALRLSIIAELDAISLYLQLARTIDDERVKRVFEDIAKEEKTHTGEFLALLKGLDPEQVEELESGAREVMELTGIRAQDPPSSESQAEPFTGEELSYLLKQFTSTADSIRVFRRYLPLTRAGRGTLSVPVERPGEPPTVLPLREIAVRFYVNQSSIDYARATKQPLEIADALRAAVELGLNEDRMLFEALAGLREAITATITSWEKPGAAVGEVAGVVANLIGAQATPPFILFISPARFSRLLQVHERTGVMELTRLKALTDVVATPVLPDDTALIVSATPRVLDIVLGADTEVEYIGPENGKHVFRSWENIGVRVRYERGIALLKQA
ncbi:MAG: family 1 encapsulin nanocompartment shell protein [Thermofilaceae archaeon]